VEQSEKLGRIEHPAVEICIGNPKDDVVIRFRDQGGGISLQDQPRVWDYSYTTVEKDNDELNISLMHMQNSTGGPIAGLGFGLPMSRVYASYFGGSLDFRSVSGHGTDVFLQFPALDFTRRIGE
jgi:signal transduction histidine kinase